MTRLRTTTRKLKAHAIESLILAIEVFNRPSETARLDGTLILLQHSFEMLLKAAIWQTRHRISEPGSQISYRFDKCLGILRSDLGVISSEEVLTLSILDSLRDCCTHNLLELPEEALYLHAQAAVSLFAELLNRLFQEELIDYIPGRVLPLSIRPPKDIQLLLDDESHPRTALSRKTYLS